MQKAYKTFECAKEKAGVYEEGMTPLAPMFHKVMNGGIEVTLDEQGRFIQACMVSDGETDTIAPVTIESESRTSGGAGSAPPTKKRKKFSWPPSVSGRSTAGTPFSRA